MRGNGFVFSAPHTSVTGTTPPIAHASAKTTRRTIAVVPLTGHRARQGDRARRVGHAALRAGRLPQGVAGYGFENRQRTSVPSTRTPSSAVSFLPSSVLRAR